MVVAETLEALKQKLIAEGKPILYLVDITGLTDVTGVARKNILTKMDDQTEFKVAVVGASKFFKFIIELFTKVVNAQEKYELFDNEQDATKWLLTPR